MFLQHGDHIWSTNFQIHTCTKAGRFLSGNCYTVVQTSVKKTSFLQASFKTYNQCSIFISHTTSRVQCFKSCESETELTPDICNWFSPLWCDCMWCGMRFHFLRTNCCLFFTDDDFSQRLNACSVLFCGMLSCYTSVLLLVFLRSCCKPYRKSLRPPNTFSFYLTDTKSCLVV